MADKKEMATDDSKVFPFPEMDNPPIPENYNHKPETEDKSFQKPAEKSGFGSGLFSALTNMFQGFKKGQGKDKLKPKPVSTMKLELDEPSYPSKSVEDQNSRFAPPEMDIPYKKEEVNEEEVNENLKESRTDEDKKGSFFSGMGTRFGKKQLAQDKEEAIALPDKYETGSDKSLDDLDKELDRINEDLEKLKI